MGKKRSQNEVDQKKTIQKLVDQRDAARRQRDEVLNGGHMPVSEHEAVAEALRARIIEQGNRIAALEQDAQNGNRLVYSELSETREHLRLTQDALKAKNSAFGELQQQHEQLQTALRVNGSKQEHLEKTVAALEKKLQEDSAVEARSTRKRLEKKTQFIQQQQTYIAHLERTLRLFSSLPAVQNYLAQLRAAKEAGTLEVTRVGSAVMEAETIEEKRPVEVIVVHGQVAP